jgi:hypothetical protein
MALFVGDPSAPTRFGTDVADTSDATGLFLKVFGGEVFAAFSEKVHTADKHTVREISSGKSAQFPKTWKVSAAYHSAGQEMLGQDTDETERVISIDGLLVSHIGIYDLDEAMSHFQVRSAYTAELGKALARVFDANVYRTIVKTARADSTLSGASSTTPFPDGIELLSADVSGTITATAGAQWWEVMRGLQVDADGRDYDGMIHLAVPPATFDATAYAQAADTAANAFLFANRDNTFSKPGAPGGSSDTIKLRNVTMYQSNLIPQTDQSADGDIKAKYRADFSGTLGVAWGNEAVGTVKLVGMGLEQTRDVRRQEDFIVAKIAVGHGPLRNEIAWEVRNT